MGKAKRERVLSDSEAKAYAKHIRTSPQKLNLVAQLIRGRPAGEALAQLSFNNRRISSVVKQVLQSAIANAENNYQYDIDNLYIKEAYVGKSIVMKRFRPRAKGRASPIKKPFSRITVILEEKKNEKNKEVKK